MKDNSDKEKFIELRAKGLSFSKISQEIGVSKPVLIKWNSEFQKEIENIRFCIAEEHLEKYQLMKVARVNMFANLLNKALIELDSRNLQGASTKELLSIMQFFDSRLKSEAMTINCITEKPWSLVENLEGVKVPLFD